MKEAGREGHSLLPAAGELAGELLFSMREAQMFEAFSEGFFGIGNAIDAGDKGEIFLNREVLVKTEALGHVADLAFDRGAFADHIKSQASPLPSIGAEQTAKHPNEGRLAAAVGAEESVDLTLADAKVDLVNDRATVEALGHTAHIDRPTGGGIRG